MNVVAKSMVVALVSLLTGAAVSVATSDPSAETTTLRCEQRIYAAPDGRLAPHLLGRMPKTTEPVMGFEVVDGLPLVALPRSLLGFTDKGINEFAVPTLVKGLSVDHASHIELQTANGFETVGKSGVEPDKFLTGRIQGRLYGSGSPVFLEVRERQGMLEFVARQTGGRPFLIGGIKGTLRAASWNRIGLAAVVGNSLYVWQAGAKNVYRLVTDAGLAAARDVVLVGRSAEEQCDPGDAGNDYGCDGNAAGPLPLSGWRAVPDGRSVAVDLEFSRPRSARDEEWRSGLRNLAAQADSAKCERKQYQISGGGADSWLRNRTGGACQAQGGLRCPLGFLAQQPIAFLAPL